MAQLDCVIVHFECVNGSLFGDLKSLVLSGEAELIYGIFLISVE